MKKVKTTNLIFLLLSISFSSFISCSKDKPIDNEISFSKEYHVYIEDANKVASKAYYTLSKESLSKKGKSVKSINELKNDKGVNYLYIINYNDGGFILLSADKRTQPVLAFSDKNNFNVEDTTYPLGLKFWLEDSKKQITSIQNSNLTQSDEERIAWERIQDSIIVNDKKIPPPPLEECYDHYEYYTKDPILNTKWEQSSGFNYELPYITCSGNSVHVLAGCGPIAIAQVMRYNEYPNDYNWSNMPALYATTTTASFIKDIHDAAYSVDNAYPAYQCTSTGLASDMMDDILKSEFNYSSATYANYNHTTVKSNISMNRPVILGGYSDTSGHAWVCDGYKTTTHYYDNCSAIGYLYLHMNWGWGGYEDGWYTYGNFNPEGTNYNTDKKMVYNIIP